MLKLYLRPADTTASLGVITMYSSVDRSAEPNIDAALQLLQTHAAKIDTVKVGALGYTCTKQIPSKFTTRLCEC